MSDAPPSERRLPSSAAAGGNLAVSAPSMPSALDEETAGELVDIALDNASPVPFWAPWLSYAALVLLANLSAQLVPWWIYSMGMLAVLFGAIGVGWFRGVRAGVRLAAVDLKPALKRRAYRMAVRRRRTSLALFMKRDKARARILRELMQAYAP